jgi:RHS repeat-associated protein
MKYTGHERDAATALDYMHARHYNFGVGRFLSVDTGTPEPPVPHGWNRYVYATNNPLRRVDPSGDSSLLFDGQAHTISLYAGNGQFIGIWVAYNNVQSSNPFGKWEDGTYTMRDTSKPHMHSGNPGADTSSGAYGAHGIFRARDFLESNGNFRTTMGVHDGQVDVGDLAGRIGAEHATDGCIRTVPAAMTTIAQTVATDPLTTIEVKNNKSPVAPPTATVSFEQWEERQLYEQIYGEGPLIATVPGADNGNVP